MVYQTSRDDCGKAVVRDLAVLLYQDDAYQVMPLKEECRDFQSIRLALDSIGLTFLSYEIKSLERVHPEQLPAIAQMKTDAGFHFVVVRRIGRKVLVDDPEFGTYTLSKDDFLGEFSGKMLLKQTVGRKPAKPSLSLFRKGEIALFLLAFVLQFLALFFAIYLLGSEKTLPFSTLALLLYALFAFLTFLLAMRVRKRLTRMVFLPYLSKTRQERDGPLLASILDGEVGKVYSLVNYGVFLSILLTIFSFNGVFFAFLAILGTVLGMVSFALNRDTNATRRYCARRENRYFSLLRTSTKNYDDVFLDSERKAERYITYRGLLSLLRMAIIALAILLYMLFVDEGLVLNFFLFHFFLTLAVSHTTEKLLKTYLDDSLESRDINSLSYPLPSFLLNLELSLGYTNRKNGGSSTDGRKKNPRLSRQDEREKGS